MCRSLPQIDITSDGRLTKCDLWTHEAQLINYCRKIKNGMVVIQVVDGLPQMVKKAVERVEFGKVEPAVDKAG